MTTYKYTSPENRVVFVIDDDGMCRSSCMASVLPVDAVVDPADVPPPPSPLEQIRALEAQYADAQAKLTRQSLLALALDKACADPLAASMDRADVHAFLLAGDNGYAALWNLEQQVDALRAQV